MTINRMSMLGFLVLLGGSSGLGASIRHGFGTHADLTNFVTRQDIKAPLFDVSVYLSDKVTKGYWFIAPYANIKQEKNPKDYYQPCQTGPTIYRNDGELVWSGACLTKNRNACDFRAWNRNGSDFLSAILPPYGRDTTGHAIIIDNSLARVQDIRGLEANTSFNMHEFNVINNGRSALHFLNRRDLVDISELNVGKDRGWVWNAGFREVDLATEDVLFEWWALDHIPLSASNVKIEGLNGTFGQAWNWIHPNSIDKNEEGDYLISARFTDCIYKISGRNGSIIWRLGGRDSTFSMPHGLNWSRQHDARFVPTLEGSEAISFLDNAKDNLDRQNNSASSSYSSGVIVSLGSTVALVQRFIRPDRKISELRGNFQPLPGGNWLGAWSDNSYISEHTSDGNVVMEAQFKSQRFVTYRAWKFNFTSNPREAPVLKAFAYGTRPRNAVSVFYMSWNGATEVSFWRIMQVNNSTGETEVIGTTRKKGFETMYQSEMRRAPLHAVVVALAGDGSELRRSAVEAVDWPTEWLDDRDVREDAGEPEQNVKSEL